MIDAIVLAGGRSRRMGTDKAVLTIEGERLVDRVVRVLSPLGGRIVVAVGRQGRLGSGGWEQVGDVVPGAGPLSGLVAGLEVLDGPLAGVVAVDHPTPDVELLRDLAGAWDGRSVVVAPKVGGRLQPLHAVWATAAAPALRRRLGAGQRSVVAAAETLGLQELDVPAGAWSRDLDTPQDLQRGGWA